MSLSAFPLHPAAGRVAAAAVAAAVQCEVANQRATHARTHARLRYRIQYLRIVRAQPDCMRAHLQMLHFRLHALIYFLWRHGCGWGGRGSGQAAYSGVKLDQSQDVPNCSRNLHNRRVKPSHVKTSRTITTEFTTLPSRIIGQTPVISICSLAQKRTRRNRRYYR